MIPEISMAQTHYDLTHSERSRAPLSILFLNELGTFMGKGSELEKPRPAPKFQSPVLPAILDPKRTTASSAHKGTPPGPRGRLVLCNLSHAKGQRAQRTVGRRSDQLDNWWSGGCSRQCVMNPGLPRAHSPRMW